MIQRSRILIVSILAAQFVCVISCVFWYAGWQEAAWRNVQLDRNTAYSRAVAENVANTLAHAVERADAKTYITQQSAVTDAMADISDAAHWQVDIADIDGSWLTAKDTQPNATPDSPQHWMMNHNGSTRPLLTFVAPSRHETIAGQVETNDGPRWIAATDIPNTPFSVVVHTKANGAVANGIDGPGAPFRRVGVAIAVVLVLLTGIVTVRIIKRYESRLSVLNKQLEQKVFERTSALVQTRDAVMFGLARLAESRDRETGEHIKRLQKLSALLARKMSESHDEIDEAWVERVRLASALHDVGKVGVPDAILLKPGPLTSAERQVMQNHTELGAECLSAISDRLGENDFMAMAREIALCHHERWDGSGYPNQLHSDKIPLAARIVAVADVYDAASTARVYKSAKSHEMVRELIVGFSGILYDPQVVEAFIAVEEEFRKILEPHVKCNKAVSLPTATQKRITSSQTLTAAQQ